MRSANNQANAFVGPFHWDPNCSSVPADAWYAPCFYPAGFPAFIGEYALAIPAAWNHDFASVLNAWLKPFLPHTRVILYETKIPFTI
jgi:hypothetical protein